MSNNQLNLNIVKTELQTCFFQSYVFLNPLNLSDDNTVHPVAQIHILGVIYDSSPVSHPHPIHQVVLSPLQRFLHYLNCLSIFFLFATLFFTLRNVKEMKKGERTV